MKHIILTHEIRIKRQTKKKRLAIKAYKPDRSLNSDKIVFGKMRFKD